MNLPFNLPFEVCEIILGYLNTTDLLNCCLVSKYFNEFIGHHMMKNIQLIIYDNTDISEVIKSERIYKKIKITKLCNEDLINILKIFSSTVFDLEIHMCFLKTFDNVTMSFPCLKELTLSRTSSNVILPFLQNTCSRLRIFNLYYHIGRHESIMKFLKLHNNLQEINFYLDHSCNIFSSDISAYSNFHLTSVFISYKSDFEIDAISLTNIENFLKSQGETLEIITLINSANFMLLHRIWNHLPLLKRLYMFAIDPFFDHEVFSLIPKLKINSLIEELELHALGPFPMELKDLLPFLTAACNIKSLAVWKLKTDLIEFAARNLLKLKTIACAVMESNCEEFYNELKSKNCTGRTTVNDKLHLHQYL